jgi:hypothetical protein
MYFQFNDEIKVCITIGVCVCVFFFFFGYLKLIAYNRAQFFILFFVV